MSAADANIEVCGGTLFQMSDKGKTSEARHGKTWRYRFQWNLREFRKLIQFLELPGRKFLSIGLSDGRLD